MLLLGHLNGVGQLWRGRTHLLCASNGATPQCRSGPQWPGHLPHVPDKPMHLHQICIKGRPGPALHLIWRMASKLTCCGPVTVCSSAAGMVSTADMLANRPWAGAGRWARVDGERDGRGMMRALECLMRRVKRPETRAALKGDPCAVNASSIESSAKVFRVYRKSVWKLVVLGL